MSGKVRRNLARGERLFYITAHRKILGKPINSEMKRSWASHGFFGGKYTTPKSRLIRMMGVPE